LLRWPPPWFVAAMLTGGAVPTYQYACVECDEKLEVVQKFTDEPLRECPACAGRLRKVFSAVGVVFKGSGFYRNDSRSDSRGGKGSSERAGSNGDSKSGDSKSGESTSGDSKSGSTSSDSSSGTSGGSSDGKSAGKASSSSSSSGSGSASSKTGSAA
jgi:putative FmdB family regulatory protein